MYIPEHFRVRDQSDVVAFMRANPFAILISSGGAEPFEVFLPQLPRTSTNRALLARSAVGSTFMAALELARGAELALDQDAAFQGIGVTPLAAPVAAQYRSRWRRRHTASGAATRAPMAAAMARRER